jgi:hypothetical protein
MGRGTSRIRDATCGALPWCPRRVITRSQLRWLWGPRRPLLIDSPHESTATRFGSPSDDDQECGITARFMNNRQSRCTQTTTSRRPPRTRQDSDPRARVLPLRRRERAWSSPRLGRPRVVLSERLPAVLRDARRQAEAALWSVGWRAPRRPRVGAHRTRHLGGCRLVAEVVWVRRPVPARPEERGWS